MRVLRLFIGEYRVLSQLDMRFDPGQPKQISSIRYHLDFLVGVNGTGKSTALRLLGRIFRGVQRSFDELSDLPFILEYWLESRQTKVLICNIHPTNRQEPLPRYFVTTAPGLNEPYETSDLDEQHLLDNVPTDLLPDRIIAYTTGIEAEWSEHLEDTTFNNSSLAAIRNLPAQERALIELPGWPKRVDLAQQDQQTEAVRYRFIFQKQLVYVTLAGLLQHCTYEEKESPLHAVLEETSTSKLAGFTLDFQLPYATPVEKENLWQRLGQFATRSIQSGSTFRLVFDLTSADLASKILDQNGGSLSFFELLADWSTGENPILEKVTLLLERTPKKPSEEEILIPPLHTWDWLSDGERSFISRMCLFSLFGEVESLILLDEPEVHFNDYWKRHIVSTMHQVFEKKNGASISHVVIATHSSISLSDVHPEDIIILKRDGLKTDTSSYPHIQTFGADPGDIMVHVFEAPYAAGQHSVNEFEILITRAQQGTISRRELQARIKHVAPGYWSYRLHREILGMQ